MRIDRAFRRSLERVLVPFWRIRPLTDELPEGIRVYDLDGLPDRYLELSCANGLFVIKDQEREEVFGGIGAMTAGFVDAADLDAAGDGSGSLGNRRAVRAPAASDHREEGRLTHGGARPDGATRYGLLFRLSVRFTTGEQVDLLGRTGRSPLPSGRAEGAP